jgi:uncharacterized HAD superfamily protein
MGLRLGIDFDGTIVEANYPKIGKLKPNAVEVINKLYNEDYKILINTCRAGIYEGHCYQFLKKHGIPYHYINSNLPKDIEFFGQDCRKISADIYIDDKQLGGIPDDWNEIYFLIKRHEKLFKL